MSPDHVPLGPINAVAAIVETDARLIDLLDGLSLQDWEVPTIVPRWRVRHVAGHLLDTALRRLATVRDGYAAERPASDTAADLRAFVNRVNAEGVAVYGRLSPRVLAAHMQEATVALHEHFRQLDPTAPAVFAVSWAGDSQSPNWFDIARELTERWHHQQQIRLALDRPGILTPALYYPVLDCFMRVLPHAYRRVPAPPGTVVEVEVDGDGGGAWHLCREPDRWMLVGEVLDPPAARVIIPGAIAWRLFTKGIAGAEAEPQLAISGDRALATPVLAATAIVG